MIGNSCAARKLNPSVAVLDLSAASFTPARMSKEAAIGDDRKATHAVREKSGRVPVFRCSRARSGKNASTANA
jgi:hypothetical protein